LEEERIFARDGFFLLFLLVTIKDDNGRVVDNYLVCYVIDPGVVTVTDVLYGASDVHKRLQERHM